jgi:hypothetical protein
MRWSALPRANDRSLTPCTGGQKDRKEPFDRRGLDRLTLIQVDLEENPFSCRSDPTNGQLRACALRSPRTGPVFGRCRWPRSNTSGATCSEGRSVARQPFLCGARQSSMDRPQTRGQVSLETVVDIPELDFSACLVRIRSAVDRRRECPQATAARTCPQSSTDTRPTLRISSRRLCLCSYGNQKGVPTPTGRLGYSLRIVTCWLPKNPDH